MTISASVALVTGAAGGGAAAAVAGSAMAGSAGSATLSMIGAVQRFALSAGVSANLSDMYRGAACGLQWSNFQFSLLGSGSRPACQNYQYNAPVSSSPMSGTVPAAGRRLAGAAALLGDWEDVELHGELFVSLSDLNTALYRQFFNQDNGVGSNDWTVGRRQLLGSSTPISQVVLQAYERLLIILIILVSGIILHWITLKLWASVRASTTSQSEPVSLYPYYLGLRQISRHAGNPQTFSPSMCSVCAAPRGHCRVCWSSPTWSCCCCVPQ